MGVPSEKAEAELKKRDEMHAQEQEQVSSSGLYEEMHRHEAKLIRQALIKAQGRITQAARLLDISYQTLGNILKTRHRDLRSLRTPVKRRRKSYLKK